MCPAMVAMRDNKDYTRVLLYSYRVSVRSLGFRLVEQHVNTTNLSTLPCSNPNLSDSCFLADTLTVVCK